VKCLAPRVLHAVRVTRKELQLDMCSYNVPFVYSLLRPSICSLSTRSYGVIYCDDAGGVFKLSLAENGTVSPECDAYTAIVSGRASRPSAQL